MLESVECREGLFEVVSADLVVVDVDRLEQRLVEEPALFVVAAQVELLGVFQQPETQLDEAGASG
ncbi:MAG TPA: hypothetical protein VF444_19340 [Pseudonocardiaceae bacterium]